MCVCAWACEPVVVTRLNMYIQIYIHTFHYHDHYHYHSLHYITSHYITLHYMRSIYYIYFTLLYITYICIYICMHTHTAYVSGYLCPPMVGCWSVFLLVCMCVDECAPCLCNVTKRNITQRKVGPCHV